MSALEVLNLTTRSPRFSKLCALGVMTKAPQPGKVKTRLCPPLTPDESAALNICFLRDISSSIKKAATESPAAGVGIYTPAGTEDVYDSILPGGFFLIRQRGETFGERLMFAVCDLLSVGFASVCLINSDSPMVPASCFAEAAEQLARPGDRIVLGPSEDGGYYLIGQKQLHKRLFEEIDWSTERVFGQTLERAEELQLPVHELASGLDVDDRESLGQLGRTLLDGVVASQNATHTRTFLQEIIKREGRERICPAM